MINNRKNGWIVDSQRTEESYIGQVLRLYTWGITTTTILCIQQEWTRLTILQEEHPLCHYEKKRKQPQHNLLYCPVPWIGVQRGVFDQVKSPQYSNTPINSGLHVDPRGIFRPDKSDRLC